MRNALPCIELSPCNLNVAKELDFFENTLILGDIQDDGGTVASLRQNQRSLLRPDLGDKTCRVRPKVREWANILHQVRSLHDVPPLIRPSVSSEVGQPAVTRRDSGAPSPRSRCPR